jgi:hypothetical protein
MFNGAGILFIREGKYRSELLRGYLFFSSRNKVSGLTGHHQNTFRFIKERGKLT